MVTEHPLIALTFILPTLSLASPLLLVNHELLLPCSTTARSRLALSLSLVSKIDGEEKREESKGREVERMTC